ncbi:hypothetical protein [Paenibacillus sp. FSL P4-0081]|uniref:hypothetical protein n=1 Tax=Paenibacillus sp. FSL P4-0081 TaxID=1536769 RepID=UPI0006936D9C|nr:hypothetical protein [Paenibacillus sp. FSL P4-0081]
MPADSFPFPIFSGLFSPQHYNNIGSAIWLFAWCISSTTKEVEEDGTVWGLVLGGKPMKLSEIGGNFGVTDKSISRWISDLQEHGYLHITRAPRGLIIRVRKSKKDLLKRSDKRVPTLKSDQTIVSDQNESDQTGMSDQDDRDQTYLSVHTDGDQTFLSVQNDSDQTYMSDQRPGLGSDQTKMSDAKDITITTTITNLEKEWWEEEPNQIPPENDMFVLMKAYCVLHGRSDIHVSPKEREAMGNMVTGGIPIPFTIRTMETMYREKQAREGEDFEQANSFAYYTGGIKKAWKNTQTVSKTDGKPGSKPRAKAAPSDPPRKTKQQQEMEDLQRRMKEAEDLEKSASDTTPDRTQTGVYAPDRHQRPGSYPALRSAERLPV